MTTPKPTSEFLAFLMSFVEEADNIELLGKLEDDVSLDFVNALSQWVNSQANAARDNNTPLTYGNVVASVCYWLAMNVANTATKRDQICRFTAIYGDYIHQAAHSIQDGERRAREAGSQ